MNTQLLSSRTRILMIAFYVISFAALVPAIWQLKAKSEESNRAAIENSTITIAEGFNLSGAFAK